MKPFVVNSYTGPQPPVARMVALPRIATIVPPRRFMATTPVHAAPSTMRLVTKYSSNRWMRSYFIDVWKRVWRMWKPTLSAAYTVRLTDMPPNARWLTRPSSSRDHGQPQCSRRMISSGHRATKNSTASWSEIIRLEHWGCPWSRDEGGRVSQRAFGGMSVKRTVYAADKVGFHILHTLFQTSMKYDRIHRFDEYFVTSLIVDGGACTGVVAMNLPGGTLVGVQGKGTTLARSEERRVGKECRYRW